MLCNLGASRGGHYCRRSRNVESVRGISPCPASVDQEFVAAGLHGSGELAHYLCCCGDLPDGFLFYPEPHHESSDLRLGQLAAHDLPHDVEHLVMEDFAMFNRSL